MRHITRSRLFLAALLGLAFLPSVGVAMDIPPGCTHFVTDLSSGSGGYSGQGCSEEVLAGLGARNDLSVAERVDALKALVQSLTAKIAVATRTPSSLCPTYESTPVLTSITPAAGAVGTTLTLKGCNFMGFESDKMIWFENSAGLRGVLNAANDDVTRASNVEARITVPASLCTSDTSYSGLPCPSTINLIPGTYSVYASSYGGKSNPLTFTVTKTETNPTSCFVPSYDLYLGRTDEETSGEVSKLQCWLKDTGYFPDAQCTGYYGAKTAEAVVRWQKAHGMDFVTTKSGVGKMTRKLINLGCSTARMTATGELSYSDMSGFGNFKITKIVDGDALTNLTPFVYFGKTASGSYRTLDSRILHDVFGNLSPKGDSCSIVREVTVEITRPQPISGEALGTPSVSGAQSFAAEYLRTVSTGRVYDDCAAFDGQGNYSGTTRTERK